jgi:hypothetical protein
MSPVATGTRDAPAVGPTRRPSGLACKGPDRARSASACSGVSQGIDGAGQLDQECNVVSLGSVGVHVVVQCFGLGFGRLDGTKFTPLEAFPSPSSSGISGQSAAAW